MPANSRGDLIRGLKG